MSMWLDPPDTDVDGLGAGLGLQYDDAPAAEGIDTDDLLAPVGAGEPWTPEQGYPDSTQSVHIWVDPDTRRLTKVRISNRWRDRAKGTSLSSMFDEAFLLASARIPDAQQVVDITELADPSEHSRVPDLSWESVIAAGEATMALQRRLAELDQMPPEQVQESTWQGAEAVGASRNTMVTVTLDVHGGTRKVDFNSAWLNQSRVSEVCDCVMEAHRAAYEAHQPPTYEPGERMKLAMEAQRLSNQTIALIRQGGTR